MKGCPGCRELRQEAGTQRRETKSASNDQKRATADREAMTWKGVAEGGPVLRAYMHRRP